jgi:peptidoglycan/LPS O-acetylase OafA/YrhL
MRRVSVESSARLLITASVGLIGAAAGFTHTHDAALRSGQTGWLAWADAVVIECMVVVAGLQLVRDRKDGRSGTLALSVLVVAFLIQMGAQVSGAPGTFAGWLFAAIPALGCLVVVKFAFRTSHGATSRGQTEVATATAERTEAPEADTVRELEPALPVQPLGPRVQSWPPVSA